MPKWSMRKLSWVSVMLLGGAVAAGFAALGRGGGAPDGSRAFQVTGVVAAVPDGRSIRIAHDDVPDYMPGMTMPFTVGAGEPVPAVTPGDRVRFTLRVAEDRSWITGIEVTGRGPVPGGAARSGASARLRPGDAVPAFALVDETGQALTEADLGGRLTVVTFLFTRCPVPEFCPLIAQRFREIQDRTAGDRALQPRMRLLAVTLDPAFDTPPVLAAYAKAKGSDPARWRFATGTPEAVAVLTRAFAVHVEANGATLDHTLATALIDEEGRVVEIWRGNFWKASEIITALRTAAGS